MVYMVQTRWQTWCTGAAAAAAAYMRVCLETETECNGSSTELIFKQVMSTAEGYTR